MAVEFCINSTLMGRKCSKSPIFCIKIIDKTS